MLQCCPSCKETGLESRLRFHYLALDKGVWLCPREDCTFPLGHEELESFVVNVTSKSSSGSLSSLATPDTDVSPRTSSILDYTSIVDLHHHYLLILMNVKQKIKLAIYNTYCNIQFMALGTLNFEWSISFRTTTAVDNHLKLTMKSIACSR